jgi:hypothetical protein
VSFAGIDPLSGVAPDGCDAPVTVGTDGRDQSVTGACRDRAGNAGSATASGISIDRTPPVATATKSPAANANGWNNTNVTVTFEGADSLSGSGIASCTAPTVLSAEAAGQSASGTCSDVAGNTSQAATASGINIDKTAPAVAITTPQDGATYSGGTAVTAAYQCTDALAGIGSCDGTAENGAPIDTSGSGGKSFTVTASDRAGNTAAATHRYTVVAGYSIIGFHQPIDSPPNVNVVKAGRVVPVKWSLMTGDSVYVGDTETFRSLTSVATSCSASAPADPIEESYSSGSTGLRYDSATNQFIYNWQTSGSWKGKCRTLILELADGQRRQASFRFQ